MSVDVVVSRRALPAGTMSLAQARPDLAAEWDFEANEGLVGPEWISSGSDARVHWVCSKDQRHRWVTSVCNRTGKDGTGCPVCSGRKLLIGVNDLATLYPAVAAEWDHEFNGDMQPTHVTPGSGYKAHWVCSMDSRHRWESKVRARALDGAGCPVCSGRQVLAGFNDLATTHPDIAAEWDSEANGDLRPTDVTAGSNRKVHWVCSKDARHRWKASISDRTGKNVGCPVCSGRQVLVGVNDFATTHPAVAALWDYQANGTLRPTDVTAGSNRKVHWVCSKDARHKWASPPQSLTGSRKQGCPVCSGRQVLVGVNDLATLYPALAAEWDYEANGALRPTDITPGSNQRVHWVCSRDARHKWDTFSYGRTGPAASGCPHCTSRISRGETDLADTLAALVPSLTMLRNDQSTIPGRAELDIFFPVPGVAIEFNGLYWHSEATGTSRNAHANKSRLAADQGIQLIHVWEDDWRDRRTIVLRSILTKLGALDDAARIDSDLQPFVRRVHARACTVADVPKAEAQQFLAQHHIQGPKGGSVRLGLRDANGDLVALLVASVFGQRATIERFATACMVRGGFSRLEKALTGRVQDVTTLVTFADIAISDSGLYEATGWTRDGQVPPDYQYVVGGSRSHKFNYRLARFRNDPALVFQEGLSERELAHLNGLPRIWDAGKVRWTKSVSSSAAAVSVLLEVA